MRSADSRAKRETLALQSHYAAGKKAEAKKKNGRSLLGSDSKQLAYHQYIHILVILPTR